ncbi:MAG: HupE/UreJ family protein [Acidobacteria bacterium]|nr:HupE/UreJ family protein [Acidobacteriota bacterium]
MTAVPANGHEVRPGYLELNEVEAGRFEVVWKQPRRGALLLLLDPVLPEYCTEIARQPPENLAGALLERWTVDCAEEGVDPDRTFHGDIFGIAGLERTLTDVLLRISFENGDSLTQLLRPEAPTVTVDREAAGNALPYFRLGVEHLVFGFDHILFVIGLLFYVRSPWRLVGVITSFTLAHSITLALSSLDVVKLSSAPVEAVIALSILFLAVELLRPEEKRSPITTKSPWLIAFAFGLLHGFGFAGALAEIGLPQRAIALALFLFNVGVEVGQLLVVAVVLAAVAVVKRVGIVVPELILRTPIYATGIIAAFWFVERVARIVV